MILYQFDFGVKTISKCEKRKTISNELISSSNSLVIRQSNLSEFISEYSVVSGLTGPNSKPVNGFSICGNYELTPRQSFICYSVRQILCTYVRAFFSFFFWFKLLLAVRVKKKTSKTRTNYSMYDNYYCGQSLINERTNEQSTQTNRIKRIRKKYDSDKK